MTIDDDMTATLLCALDDAAGFWREQVASCACASAEEPCPSCSGALTDADAYEHAYAVLAEGDLEPAGRAVEVVRLRGALL
jgi:hypothetical protein